MDTALMHKLQHWSDMQEAGNWKLWEGIRMQENQEKA